MTPERFARAVHLAGANPESRTSQAARLALVDRLAPHAAAKRIGVQPGNVYRAIAKLTAAIEAGVCPMCGHALDEKNLARREKTLDVCPVTQDTNPAANAATAPRESGAGELTMYTTSELIAASGLDRYAAEALLEARGEGRDARLTADHIEAALAICKRKADESRAAADVENPLFGEPNPDRSGEWESAADEIYHFAARLKIRPAADYP